MNKDELVRLIDAQRADALKDQLAKLVDGSLTSKSALKGTESELEKLKPDRDILERQFREIAALYESKKKEFNRIRKKHDQLATKARDLRRALHESAKRVRVIEKQAVTDSVEDVVSYVNPDGPLSITPEQFKWRTNNIYITTEGGLRTSKHFGQFDILVRMDGNRLYCTMTQVDGSSEFGARNGAEHPHVAHGGPCLGNASDLILRAFKNYDFNAAVVHVNTFLTHYYGGNPYVALGNWERLTPAKNATAAYTGPPPPPSRPAYVPPPCPSCGYKSRVRRKSRSKYISCERCVYCNDCGKHIDARRGSPSHPLGRPTCSSCLSENYVSVPHMPLALTIDESGYVRKKTAEAFRNSTPIDTQVCPQDEIPF